MQTVPSGFAIVFPEVLAVEYGYIRVSSKEQNVDRQLDALYSMGLHAKQIYIDKQSGKRFDRPAYQKLVKKLRAGDLLVVKSIDRLGRNYDEILDQWRVITKIKRADIYVIDFPLLDTRKKDNDLTLLPIQFSRFFRMWHKRNGNSSTKGRQRASRRRRKEACSSAESVTHCRTDLRMQNSAI